jgi:hypothetical protein
MPNQPSHRPLGGFLRAHRQENSRCILLWSMAGIAQGAAHMAVVYDF